MERKQNPRDGFGFVGYLLDRKQVFVEVTSSLEARTFCTSATAVKGSDSSKVFIYFEININGREFGPR